MSLATTIAPQIEDQDAVAGKGGRIRARIYLLLEVVGIGVLVVILWMLLSIPIVLFHLPVEKDVS